MPQTQKLQKINEEIMLDYSWNTLSCFLGTRIQMFEKHIMGILWKIHEAHQPCQKKSLVNPCLIHSRPHTKGKVGHVEWWGGEEKPSLPAPMLHTPTPVPHGCTLHSSLLASRKSLWRRQNKPVFPVWYRGNLWRTKQGKFTGGNENNIATYNLVLY